ESRSVDKPVVDEFVRFVGARFAAMAAQVEVAHADKFGDHMIARFTGSSSERILLLGHTDTVWPAGEITKRPFKITGGRAFGPGVFDMKAGILLIAMAIDALQKVDRSLDTRVAVVQSRDV